MYVRELVDYVKILTRANAIGALVTMSVEQFCLLGYIC